MAEEKEPTVTFGTMSGLDSLFLIRDVVNVLVETGVVTVGSDGHAHAAPLTAAEIEALAPKVEAFIKQYGVSVPSKVDAILASLPLILALAGIK